MEFSTKPPHPPPQHWALEHAVTLSIFELEFRQKVIGTIIKVLMRHLYKVTDFQLGQPQLRGAQQP